MNAHVRSPAARLLNPVGRVRRVAPHQSSVPSPFSWDSLASNTIANILAALVVSLLTWMLLRPRPRAASWNERKAALNEQIRVRLRQIIEAQRPLSDEEDRNDPPLTPAEYERLVNQSREARADLLAIVEEHRYMLAPRVTEIVETFFRTQRDPDMGSNRPDLVVFSLASDAYRDLLEFLPADVGPDRGVGWRYRRLYRWLYRTRYRVKRWFIDHVGLWDSRIKDFALLTGPQLTQDNVRNPPRVRHWQTVEQMKAKGGSRLNIQRHLYEQLGADPPLWLPVPLAGPFRSWRDAGRPASPRLHDRTRLGPLRTGDAADMCAHGVLLTETCRSCGFVVMPKDFSWGAGLPEEDPWPPRRRRDLRHLG
jgi:hypothetical protein